MDHHTVTVRGTELAFLEAGEGPLALCLHGFPDTAHTWRHLLPRLAEAGFRAVAPFNRGYAPSAVPTDGFFQSGALAADANALHDALGADGDAVVIGHDWGALATYGAAGAAPDRWRRAVALAVPPTVAMGTAMFTYAQLRRSWYMFCFQHGLADLLVAQDDLAFLDHLWSDWSPGYDASEDLLHVKAALREPANLAAALGTYRATLGDGPQSPDLAGEQTACGAVPPQPTLYLHGSTDGCMGVEVARAAAPAFDLDGYRHEVIEGVGHFLHLEAPDEVNGRILAFLTS
ncbi:MAG: alpha/beta hydrolase [Acidimicrobiales bacterium]|nr:alpha/beta hydrolase [Acidimicrobiales bacterium]